jgi:hypothetical protein
VRVNVEDNLWLQKGVHATNGSSWKSREDHLTARHQSSPREARAILQLKPSLTMSKIKTVGIAGTGLIGAGWAARLLIRFDVIAYDITPPLKQSCAAIDVAWPSMSKLLGHRQESLVLPLISRRWLQLTSSMKRPSAKISGKGCSVTSMPLPAPSYHLIVVLRLPAHHAAIPAQHRARDYQPSLPGLSSTPLVETVPGAKLAKPWTAPVPACGSCASEGKSRRLYLRPPAGKPCGARPSHPQQGRRHHRRYRRLHRLLRHAVGPSSTVLTYHVAGGGRHTPFHSQFICGLPWTDCHFRWNDTLQNR